MPAIRPLPRVQVECRANVGKDPILPVRSCASDCIPAVSRHFHDMRRSSFGLFSTTSSRSPRVLTLSQAQAIAAAAAAEAKSLGMPVAVAVVDHRCGIVLALRLDGAKPSSLTTARSKAEAAAMAAEETEYLVHPDCLAVLAGGLPVHLSGQLAGGVGVRGAHPEVNERVARAGLSALT
jgi:glc operon protein GlcG